MKIASFCFALVLTLVALPLSAHAAPTLDTPCEIQLRRDATGSGSSNGTRVGFNGTLKSVDKDWVCVDAGDLGEVWIPVSSIQYISLHKPKS